MNIIFLGAPGAGKGTQAEIVSERFGIPAISTGAIIREAIKTGTEMGLEARKFTEKGALVPDEVVIGIIKERLAKDDCQKGFILDGFPRTVPQAEALDQMGVSIDRVVSIEVSDERIIERMCGRRVCPACGATYHTVSLPSKDGKTCDKCGGGVVLKVVGLVDLGKINGDLGISLGLEVYLTVGILGCDSDDISVDSTRKNAASVVVSVVTGDLASAGNGEDAYFVVLVTVKLDEGVKSSGKSFSLCLGVGIEVGILFKATVLYKFFEF